MNPASPAPSTGMPGIQVTKAPPILSTAVPGPANACSTVMSDQATKMAASPTRVPTRTMKAPAGIWPAIMPRLNATAL